MLDPCTFGGTASAKILVEILNRRHAPSTVTSNIATFLQKVDVAVDAVKVLPRELQTYLLQLMHADCPKRVSHLKSSRFCLDDDLRTYILCVALTRIKGRLRELEKLGHKESAARQAAKRKRCEHEKT